MLSFGERIHNAWNAFLSRDPTLEFLDPEVRYGSSIKPDLIRLTGGRERSIVTAIYTRIAIDAASIDWEHVQLNDEGKYQSTINSHLNNALTRKANLDQTAFDFKLDAVLSLCDEGTIAIVPTDTTADPRKSEAFDVGELRVGKVVQWYPQHVKVRLYNERNGKFEEIVVQKRYTSIIQNPLYSVMNERHSVAQQLIRTMNDLDIYNRNNNSGRLDVIIQLPYSVKSETKREHAEKRRKTIEQQLTGSKYGIAYTDATEKITQLNRPVENQYWQQVQDLTTTLYNQLGMTQGVFDGTASESEMLNYYNRTINPILITIMQSMESAFLSKTAITQGQALRYFRNPFSLVPAEKLADIADKLTRNEIASSNEMRAEIGWKPVNDPAADELRNKNLNKQEGADPASTRKEFPEEQLQ